MKIARQIAEKTLSHCSQCGGCPMAKIMDTQMETEREGQSPAKKTLRQGAQSQSPLCWRKASSYFKRVPRLLGGRLNFLPFNAINCNGNRL